MRLPKAILIGVGVLSILMAAFGLLYSASILQADFSELAEEGDLPYFYPAFYTMSAICIVCNVVILLCGFQFVMLGTSLLKLFSAVAILEVVCFLSISMLSLSPTSGMSIVAGAGLASGGLSAQTFTLFPLWAPVAVWWAKKFRPEDAVRPDLIA